MSEATVVVVEEVVHVVETAGSEEVVTVDVIDTPVVVEVGILGPQGPPGVIAGGDVVVENLIGTPDGDLSDFELSGNPVANTLMVYMNGLAQTPALDYTVSGTTVSFIEAPWAGDILRASYVREES